MSTRWRSHRSSRRIFIGVFFSRLPLEKISSALQITDEQVNQQKADCKILICHWWAIMAAINWVQNTDCRYVSKKLSAKYWLPLMRKYVSNKLSAKYWRATYWNAQVSSWWTTNCEYVFTLIYYFIIICDQQNPEDEL